MPGQPTFIEVQRYLKGVDYPCRPEQLVSAAQDEGAPDEILDLLRGLDDRDYDAPTEISEAIAADSRS